MDWKFKISIGLGGVSFFRSWPGLAGQGIHSVLLMLAGRKACFIAYFPIPTCDLASFRFIPTVSTAGVSSVASHSALVWRSYGGPVFPRATDCLTDKLRVMKYAM